VTVMVGGKAAANVTAMAGGKAANVIGMNAGRAVAAKITTNRSTPSPRDPGTVAGV